MRRKVFTVIAVLAVLALIAVGAVTWLGRPGDAPPPDPAAPTEHAAPDPAPAQPEWCPQVQFISAPGTWESAPEDDPLNPQANPYSFMLSITDPLREAYDPGQVLVWTLPYTAQFKNINADHEMSYDESRAEGMTRLSEELDHMNQTCPGTDYILAGFSQGAVIVGDLADQIGAGLGPVPADKVRGVALVADGRRENGVGVHPGQPLGGIGAEIALEPVNNVIQLVVPGATMRGIRPHGFGELADRTFQFCSPDDSICDAPLDISNAIGRALDLAAANGIHAQYASNPDVIPGTTTPQWILDWAHGLIQR
ncbi:MAG TPA: cutinase family protein [Corynebacterium sp.]|nr:cutinase family protein [Corynebacterium sp.]